MRYSTNLQSLSAANYVEPTQSLWLSEASARPRRYVVMKTCDAQRHLVAAGTLPRDGVDGAWGPKSRTAMARFVNALPSTIRGLVYTDASGQPAPLPFGSREDYRGHSGTQIRVPAAYAMAFPPKSNVPCTGGSQTTSTTVTTATDTVTAEDQTATNTSAEIVADTTAADEVVVAEDEGVVPPRPAAESGFSPWLMLAGVAIGVVAVSAYMKRTK